MYESDFEQRLHNERRDKLKTIAELGAKHGLSEAEATYPNSYAWTVTVPELRAKFDSKSGEELEADRTEVSVAGRVMAIRVQGKAGFAQIQQGGQRIQIYVRKDDVGTSPEQKEDAFALYKLLDLGDHIGVRGFLMRTRTGELTVHVAPISLPGHEGKPPLTFLAKAMLALPDKFHGLEDTELRYRQRYLDLFMNTGHTPKAAPTSAQTPVILSGARRAESKDPDDPNPAHTAENPSAPAQSPVILSGARSAESKDPAGPNPAHMAENPSAPEPASRNVRETFVKRAAILRAIRKFFDDRGYLEVETPMLHTIAGGAAARPFKTHHNALDIPLSLRIAPELFLKRLVVGGLDRVYEINRNFRNEGVSTQHNPEFTMLEFYQAYSNYHDLMDLTQELVTFVATEVNGTTITNFNGTEIDLSKWQKLSMREALVKFWPPGLEGKPTMNDLATETAFRRWIVVAWDLFGGPEAETDDALEASRQLEAAKIRGFFRALPHTVQESGGRGGPALSLMDPVGKQITTLFEIVAEPHLIQPTIIYDFPLAVSPLSKIKPNEPDWVERFEFYIGGFEVGNAFSELNDPDDQHRRFEAQLKEKERGDDEAHAMDEDYVRALGYGLPPTAGEGIGIDRLTMILTGSKSIRDVILFPLMRPQAPAAQPPEGSSQTP